MILADVLKQNLSVEDQHQLAIELAANCGYQLVAEDTERSLEIKNILDRIKNSGSIFSADNFHREKELIIQGLEALLK